MVDVTYKQSGVYSGHTLVPNAASSDLTFETGRNEEVTHCNGRPLFLIAELPPHLAMANLTSQKAIVVLYEPHPSCHHSRMDIG